MDDTIRKSSTNQYNHVKTLGSNFILLHVDIVFTELLKILSFLQLAFLISFWYYCQKSGVCGCGDLYISLGSLFYSADLMSSSFFGQCYTVFIYFYLCEE